MRIGLRSLLAWGALSVTTLALASPPPFDFTGTWTGTVAIPGIDGQGDLNATFWSDGPRTFFGSLAFGGATCVVSGRYGGRVKLHLECEHPRGERGRLNLRMHLNPAAATLSGPVHLRYVHEANGAHGRHVTKIWGTFTLTKSLAE